MGIELKNTGTTSWTKDANYKLVYTLDSAMNTWGPGVVELEEGDSIAPGDIKTFTFDITAPVCGRGIQISMEPFTRGSCMDRQSHTFTFDPC